MTTLKEAPTNGATPIVSNVKASFRAMLAPSSKPISRKAWGIDVATLWVPYFTAARAIGAVDDVELPDDALGAPFHLRRDAAPTKSSSAALSGPCSPWPHP